MSQLEQIKDYLERGFYLTPLDSLRLFGCFRLGARVFDLKQPPYNMDIRSELIKDGRKRYSRYHLELPTNLFGDR